ncbi:MAG: type IV pilin protein [Betaproteobacteria bacterium]
MSVQHRARRRGFTLIEMMIVVAIVGILAAIAYPSYETSVAKSRRKLATSCLTEIAQSAERWYTSNLTYATFAMNAVCTNDLSNFFTFTTPVLNATTFTATATPSAGQAAADATCAANLTLDQTGAKAPAACW